MFHLIMGIFIAVKAQALIYGVVVLSDCDECGFNDLGKLLFGGLALALLVGVGISILVWKLKARDGSATSFVSIPSAGKPKDAR